MTPVTFSSDTWRFLDVLEAENTKATFDRERATYQDHVVAPSAALVEQLAELLPTEVHPDLRGEAKVGRSLFRINRDVRFAKDKTPYKTHLDFIFWLEGEPPRSRPACILRLTADEVHLGSGQMGLKGDAMDRYRHALDDPTDGARLRQVLDELTADGWQLGEPSRARVPKPYAPDHPNADLLRRDGFHVTRTLPHPPEIESDAFAGWCASTLAPHRTLLDWFAAAG